MSALSSAWAWRVEGDYTPAQRLVLLAIADQANDDGECFPSQNTLAGKCHVGRQTVTSALQRFEEDGLLARRERLRANRSRTSDLIVLRIGHPLPSKWGGPSPEQAGDRIPQGRGGPESASTPNGVVRQEEGRVPEDVWAVLHDLATEKRTSLLRHSVAAVVEAFPERDALAVARELDFWARHGAGSRRTIKSLVGTYRTFMSRSDGPLLTRPPAQQNGGAPRMSTREERQARRLAAARAEGLIP